MLLDARAELVFLRHRESSYRPALSAKGSERGLVPAQEAPNPKP
jgi:hypothetical protein